MAVDFCEFVRPDQLVTPDMVDWWRDNGVELAIPGLRDKAVALQQFGVLADRGMPSRAYVPVYPWWTPDQTAGWARECVGDYPVSMLYLDTEVGRFTRDYIRATVDACRNKGFEVGDYTGKWFWDLLGNPDWLSDLKLWNAWYHKRSDHLWFDDAPYGGWVTAEGEQFAGSVQFGGNVDLSVFWVTP